MPVRIRILLVALAIAAPVSFCAAGQGNGVVAATTVVLDNQASGRRIVTEVWYAPAGNPKAEDLSFRPPLRPVTVARGAQPVSGKRPLVVVSHGNWGSRYSQGWLALKLVDSGYIVLSASHPGTVGDDQTAAGRYRLWDRSRDISFALDQVLNDPKWAALIDETRIGFVGHSFGGWTGVSLAGGRFDPVRQRAFCASASKKDPYCEGTLKDDVSVIPAADAGASYKDARIRAFYIMASGPGQGFAAESLKSIRAPFVIDTARFDEILEPLSNSSTLAKQISGAREIVRAVGHFAYVPECRPIVGRVLAVAAGIPICDDPAGVDRSAVHGEIANEVIKFFGKAMPRGN
jgi:predicted dienelactone hydrolase